jgi:16S rRNA (cytosine1402-N4)-methyltransferase
MLIIDHIPVLLDEVIDMLSPQKNKTYIDATFGAGGYSRKILQSADCKLIAIDRDPDVRVYADSLKDEFGARFDFLNIPFSELTSSLNAQSVNQVDGIIVDLGVSSMQLDTAERGFAFSKNGLLDMRMSKTGKSAYDFVNFEDETTIANILYNYADESFSRRIARAIVDARKNKAIETTFELADLVRRTLPGKFKGHKTDPATKTFQAIRIWVNDELHEIESLLEQSKHLLKIGGKVIFVTFHSIEDRLVKTFFLEHGKKNTVISRYLPDPDVADEPLFLMLNKKVIVPSANEIRDNIRSRSAKLRAAAKVREV